MNNTLRDTNSRIDRFSASLLSRLRRDRSIARMVLILLVAIGIFSILSPSVFLTGLNLQNMLLAVAEIGILSIAMMISMVTGGIDLSLVAIANLCAITVSTLYTSSTLGGTEQWGPVIILIGLGVGLVCGLVNGVLIAYVGVTPILATLGTMQIFNGLAVVWTGGKTLYGSPEALTAFGKTAVAGVPLLFIVFGLVALLVGFILNRSPLGLSLSLEGSNGTAARFSGIRSSRILLSSYLLTGFLGSLTGIVFIARNPTPRPTTAPPTCCSSSSSPSSAEPTRTAVSPPSAAYSSRPSPSRSSKVASPPCAYPPSSTRSPRASFSSASSSSTASTGKTFEHA